MQLPVAAREPAHFGTFAMFAQLDSPASSAQTRELLGWTPSEPGLLADLVGDLVA